MPNSKTRPLSGSIKGTKAVETELSILEIDKPRIIAKLKNFGAKQTQKELLKVYWYCNIGDNPEDLPWFLRVRSYSDKKFEVTWKSHSKRDSHSRTHKEINFEVTNIQVIRDFFEGIGMELYAYQEKERVSFELDEWKFDIDTYPGIPTYIEIEGLNSKHIQQAIKKLNLEDNPIWNQGERLLIDKYYSKNWYDLKFRPKN